MIRELVGDAGQELTDDGLANFYLMLCQCGRTVRWRL